MRLRRAISSLALLVAVAAQSGCVQVPERDVFVPPYAAKGCWARLYGAAQFAGPVRQLEGPVFVEALSGSPVIVPGAERIPPQPLFSEMRSVEVGPHARIVAYAEPLFRQPVLEWPPGTRVPDLAALAFHAKAQSFTLRCEA